MRKLDREKLKKNIEDRINADRAAGRVDGVAAIVVQGGETVYENTFGSRIPASGMNDVRMDTMFRLASMTKPITGVAAMIAVEKGYFSVDDEICRYLPGYENMNVGHVENGEIVIDHACERKVKIRDCLTHSSGIGTGEVGDAVFSHLPLRVGTTVKDVVDYYADKPLAFEPASAQLYSPVIALDIVARIIEMKSGMTYGEFLKKEIFEPLGMVDTTFSPTPEQWNRMIVMHGMKDGRSVACEMPQGCVFGGLPTTYESSAAGLASTAQDYIKFAQMLLGGGAYNGKQIISRELVREMSKPQLPYEIMPAHEIWGYTVRVIVSEDYGRLPVGAFGWSGAYGTHFFVDPVNDIAAVYLKNSSYDGGAGAVTANNFEIDVTSSLV